MKEKIKIICLGTNGWYDSETGNTLSILILTDSFSLVLDAGNGIRNLDRYIDPEKPVYLFLSHFHLDHISGLHILNKFRLKAGLSILGQKGTGEILGRILTPPFTVPLEKLQYRGEIIELPEKTATLPFRAEVLPLVHSSPTIGIRAEIGGKVISYCPDTGYCENAVKLSRNADILIAECAYKPGQEDINWPHLNPETAARIAAESGAARLLLVHFDAFNYPDMQSREEAGMAAAKIFPETTVSKDHLTIEL